MTRRIRWAGLAVPFLVTGWWMMPAGASSNPAAVAASATVPAVAGDPTPPVELLPVPDVPAPTPPVAPVVAPQPIVAAPVHHAASVVTPTVAAPTVDPAAPVWVRDSAGYCFQTAAASAAGATVDPTCPANQPAPAPSPTATNPSATVYVRQPGGGCTLMGAHEAAALGQPNGSPDCHGTASAP